MEHTQDRYDARSRPIDDPVAQATGDLAERSMPIEVGHHRMDHGACNSALR
jgi:hypothetical protein